MYEDIWEPTAQMTWLQKQQQKLRERREARYRSERTPTEIKLISELKGVQSRMKVSKEKSPPKEMTQPLAIKVNFEEKRVSPVEDEPKVSRFDRQRSYDSTKSIEEDPLEQVILQAQQVSFNISD